MVGDVLISLPAELVDALEAKMLGEKLTMTGMAELAIGTEADWKRVLESGRLVPVHHGEEPRQMRTTVRCDCCPGTMCRHPLVWRGKTRCACTPERTRP